MAELHDDGQDVVVFEDVVDLEDVRVGREEGHVFGFVLETLAIGGISEKGFVDDLAGVDFVGGWVEATEDGTETTTTDFLTQLVLRLHS